MERTTIVNLGSHVGKEVSISGWVDVRRDQGKMVFFDFRDRSGVVQGVVLPGSPAIEIAKEIKNEYVVQVEGLVNKRPGKNAQAGKQNGDIELEIKGIEVLSAAQILPFPKDEEVNLDTRLDNRPLTLRSARDRAIFEVQATIADAYRDALANQGFTEFQAPALVGSDAEGGSAVFKVEYFYDQNAYLATSPQLYKQILVGAFERVFTIARIFRAEKSATTRHLSELTQMDFEMGFIEDEFDVMNVLERVVRSVVERVSKEHPEAFKTLGTEVPHLGKKFPVLTLREAQEKVGATGDDMEPEHERKICEWALKEHDSDFVLITKFPTKVRAFYTMADESSSTGESRGFDLLFRGLEINSGAQRIHSYDEMVTRIKERGMNPEKFSFYLQAFKYGMPPHGGCSTGLERFTAKMLNLANVKEASLFPRDLNRIDVLLSKNESNTVPD